ncbi:MAG: 5-oxoprolinase subunit PxpA [Luminiphilus sp.]|jgi:5-oxoprolinase (ATP-hydrolysing) subunit A|nr:5-oxoprolinase subunit PxpA [Luminiphilus sp.]
MKRVLTLNCDMGESFGPWKMGDDKAIMPLIDAANIACGGHAGDPTTMRRSVELARRHNTEVGAHVSYTDKQGFGRRAMDVRGQELIDLIHFQIGALDGIARAHRTKVSFVKPHGALYHAMLADPAIMNDIMRAVSSWHAELALVVLATPRDRKTVQLAVEHGLTLRYEAFADRGYTSRGLLLARDKPGALLNVECAAEQAVAIAKDELKTPRGRRIPVNADTLCVHGDTPGAIRMIKAIRTALDTM